MILQLPRGNHREAALDAVSRQTVARELANSVTPPCDQTDNWGGFFSLSCHTSSPGEVEAATEKEKAASAGVAQLLTSATPCVEDAADLGRECDTPDPPPHICMNCKSRVCACSVRTQPVVCSYRTACTSVIEPHVFDTFPRTVRTRPTKGSNRFSTASTAAAVADLVGVTGARAPEGSTRGQPT